MIDGADRVADSTGNWVDWLAPAWTRPYLRLARLDRPIGSWLLLIPCWWSAALAADSAGAPVNAWHLLLFFIGAFAMRGAGCTWNDLVDRDLDRRVERTRSRPIPSGAVTVTAAGVFLALQALVGLAVLLQFNSFTRLVGFSSLGVVAIYPFMKRITYWPQIVLGLAFSWGALMGWPALLGRLDVPPLLLYAGAIFWVIGYDTHLCASGSRGRCTNWDQIDGSFVWYAHQAGAVSVLRACRSTFGIVGMERGRRVDFRPRHRRVCGSPCLASQSPGHSGSGSLPPPVQIEPRCGTASLCRPSDRSHAAPLIRRRFSCAR